MWRKLLKLRTQVYQFIRYEVNDGKTAFFWFDDWLQQGKLIDITGAAGTYHLGVARTARVCDAVSQEVWNIRGQRSRFFHDLYERILSAPVPHRCQGQDDVMWRHSDGDYKPYFSSAELGSKLEKKRTQCSGAKASGLLKEFHASPS
ncbi:PREDICTED: uncharacterized protein LOC106330017 [Brassica oleracea var. oleracea]|uniref:uncharacterized protein LOC106330017 n=1 Tax=Brassica oleracea var. oleracea TaxID=109376 RepID=UPI0006A6B0A2|nr:PREDICTED: uncharacterized protein LOC106330017 [Brassica oleracea var. oleracea]